MNAKKEPYAAMIIVLALICLAGIPDHGAACR